MSKEMEALEKIGNKSTYHVIIGENGFYEQESDEQDINELPEYELIHAALIKGESDAKELAEIKGREEETINVINTSINTLQNYTDVSWSGEETSRYRNQIELGIIELKSKISTITNILKGEKV